LNATKHPSLVAKNPSRRKIIVGIAAAFGSLAAGCALEADAQQDMAEAQSTGTEGLLTYLHQEVEIQASAQRIYRLLLSSKQFAGMTNLPADISPDPGGTFSTFGGLIVGRNVADLRVHPRDPRHPRETKFRKSEEG
jgi:hypothetical protein